MAPLILVRTAWRWSDIATKLQNNGVLSKVGGMFDAVFCQCVLPTTNKSAAGTTSHIILWRHAANYGRSTPYDEMGCWLQSPQSANDGLDRASRRHCPSTRSQRPIAYPPAGSCRRSQAVFRKGHGSAASIPFSPSDFLFRTRRRLRPLEARC